MRDPVAARVEEVDRRAAIAIVYTFETGAPGGMRGAIADHPDDAGGVSFGPWQATDASGALDEILSRYVDAGGEKARQVATYLDDLEDSSLPLRGNRAFRSLLRSIAAEEVTHRIQDEVFAELYVEPADRYARKVLGLKTGLGRAIVLDSFVHSGRVPRFLRRRFPELPPALGGAELPWLRAYVETRETWLTSKGGLLAATTYRMRTFRHLLDRGRGLDLPLHAWAGRSRVQIDERVLPSVV